MSNHRIAFVGNVANALFPVVRVLRTNGFDAHLFVDSSDPVRWRPETDDPALSGRYPDWIHEGRWMRHRDLLSPRTAPMLTELAEFDLVVGSGNTPMLAPYLDAPFVFYTTGADVTRQPFPIAFRTSRGGPLDQLGHGLLAHWQRRGIRAAAEIWTQPFAPFRDALRRIGVDAERISDAYVPLIVDPEQFTPAPASVPQWARDLRGDHDFVVLHPSRIVVDESPLMLRSGQTKGSASILRGFAEFVESGVTARPALILPADDGGADAAHQLIAELGIESSIVWARAPRVSGFHRTEMVHLYGAADVTVNELGAGWFGWAALESMSCGVPVVSRIDESGIAALYGEDSPWIHAQNSSDVAARLTDLAADTPMRKRCGRFGREWILRHHAPETAGARITNSMADALARLTKPSHSPAHSR